MFTTSDQYELLMDERGSLMPYDMGMSLVNQRVVVGEQRTECDVDDCSHGIEVNEHVIKLRQCN